MLPNRRLLLLLPALLLPLVGRCHENFLPLHHHSSAHEHEAYSIDHADAAPGRKDHSSHVTSVVRETRFAFATGSRFTRYSVEGDAAHLWEVGLGLSFAATPWLHLGGEISHGWFDSEQGDANGWMRPRAHLDIHLPLGHGWELVGGIEAGFPGGEEVLVGDHWEWAPHVELRYDRGSWFAEAGASLVFIAGEAEHIEHHEHAETGENEAEHHHEPDFHEIVEPHGERELQYFGAAGFRVLNQRLTIAARLAGVHILSGDEPADNYLRAGLRASHVLHERVIVTAEGTVPITEAERSQWQASVGLRIGF